MICSNWSLGLLQIAQLRAKEEVGFVFFGSIAGGMEALFFSASDKLRQALGAVEDELVPRRYGSFWHALCRRRFMRMMIS